MHNRSAAVVKNASSRLGWPLTLASAFALTIVSFTVWGFGTMVFHPKGVDFVSFWAAGRMVAEGHAVQAYDILAHRRVELAVAPDTGLMPFPYPPPFLALMAPLAILPFALAFIVWVLLTGGLYAASARRLAPLPYVLANPSVLVDAMIGQTGLLAGALIIAGAIALAETPFAGGVLFGLMIFKPQLAVMLPVALLAGRQWRAIAGAALSSISLVLLGLILFGPSAYAGFFHMLSHYAGYLRQARWNWIELASPFAFARYFGVPQSISLGIQLICAFAAASLTWAAWWQNWQTKIPILACATLLASPYLFTYDAVLMIVPAACFLAERRYWLAGFLWLLCALPVAHFFDLYQGPNTIPLAAGGSLILLAGRSGVFQWNRSPVAVRG
jgi:hypothetical protein